NIEVDQSGKDVSRACFLPYDPTAFLHKRHQAL
ncbi:MAG: VirE protein, partial [Winogradskyella sp.]|nr:VirE protein [Winogradskyella sp.]